jgi:hypothetical protein
MGLTAAKRPNKPQAKLPPLPGYVPRALDHVVHSLVAKHKDAIRAIAEDQVKRASRKRLTSGADLDSVSSTLTLNSPT